MAYEYLDHTSEIGVLATGATAEEAFAEAARGLFGIQVDRAALTPDAEVSVRVEGRDLPECLVEYLNGLIAAQDVEELLLVDAAPPVIQEGGEGFMLEGTARGVRRARALGQCETEVKAVTYQGLIARPTAEGFTARFVVDI